MPITWPRAFKTGAPLEPCEIAAEIWSSLVPLTTRDAEMIPRETVPGSWPSGFEITVTSSPSFMLSLAPQRSVTAGRPDTISIATSFAVSAAATEQRCCWPSLISMRQPAASSSTCAAVMTYPSVTKNPVPLAMSWPLASSAWIVTTAFRATGMSIPAAAGAGRVAGFWDMRGEARTARAARGVRVRPRMRDSFSRAGCANLGN